MNKEISKILDLVKSSDLDGAYKRAKILFKKDKNNIDVIKALSYVCIQKANYHDVINILEEGYRNKELLKDFDFYNNLGLAYLKVEEFEKEFGKSTNYAASVDKIRKKTLAELAQINIE